MLKLLRGKQPLILGIALECYAFPPLTDTAGDDGSGLGTELRSPPSLPEFQTNSKAISSIETLELDSLDLLRIPTLFSVPAESPLCGG